ncbi:MAG: hypothetical protein AAB440_02215 [Patescibacteria group bacterium]
MSTAESYEPVPQNLQESLLKELETKTDSVTVEYDDVDPAHEGLIVRVTGTPARLKYLFRTQHPYIRQYRIVPAGEPPVGSK